MVVNGKVRFHVVGVTAYPAERRASEISRRIEALARDEKYDPKTLRVEDAGAYHQIFPGEKRSLSEQLLIKAAKTNPLVLKSPEPRAVFLGFGDNSLKFEVRVYVKGIDHWIPMLHKMNRTIDKEFRQAGITIAFPQRDVHLDTTGPLDIRVVSEEPSGFKAARRPSAPQREPES